MYSPESKINRNHSGKDFGKLKHTWQAQWITYPAGSTLDYGVFLFRNNFTLKSEPVKFIIFISADNRYRLFVNGQFVCYGPAIGDLGNYRYETLDISQYLVKGKNVIAAEVVNFGEYKKVAQISYQTAFILQGHGENQIDINTGTANWKVFKNIAYSPIPITSKMLNSYYAAGPCDRFDASDYPWGWKDIDFDDSTWLKPKKAITEFAVGRGFLYGSAWFLVTRTIPLMISKKENFISIVRTNGIEVDNLFLKGENPVVIPENSKVSILFDQTYHTTGFPELFYSKGKGSSIKITYSEALFKDEFLNSNISDGNLLLVDVKGNRNELEGKSIFGYYDIVLPVGGAKRLFRPLSRRTYRFVQLDIQTKDEILILEKYYSVFMGYPFEEKAKFEADDEALKNIWNAGWRTLKNSAGESFSDPYYEQLQYIGDTRIESLVSIYVAGDDRLMRKAIKQFDDSRIPEGLTQSRYPSNILQVIPPYSLLWIDMIHDFFMYRDDPDFLRQFIPGIKSVLEWFGEKVDDKGVLSGLEWWNFTDWAQGFSNGIPPGADDGYTANISLQFVKSLQNAAELFSFFGLQTESNNYSRLAEDIKKGVMTECFDYEKGLFAETPEKNIFSQHTNILGILVDIGDIGFQRDLMEKILYDDSLIQTTIYYKFYLFRALQKVGFGNRYLDMLSPWKRMLEMGMTTFGETDINPRSDCHGWSASPNFDFLHTIAGIYSGEYSFNTVIIEPNLGKLESLYVELPHPKGMIKVLYEKLKEGLYVELSLPEKVNGVFKWRNRKLKLKNGEQTFIIK